MAGPKFKFEDPSDEPMRRAIKVTEADIRRKAHFWTVFSIIAFIAFITLLTLQPWILDIIGITCVGGFIAGALILGYRAIHWFISDFLRMKRYGK